MNREFLMLAHKYDGQDIIGWLMSEKLDGMRAFWDGGISRGKRVGEVDFANHALKSDHIATGLWSRYGNAIQAPEWWLNQLPPYPLDGELWSGYGQFQKIMSVVKDYNPGPGWETIRYHVFDQPELKMIYWPGKINNPNFKKFFAGIEYPQGMPFDSRCPLQKNKVIVPVQHFKIYVMNQVDEMMQSVLAKGGEGLIVRHPGSMWQPIRSHNLLKVKPFDDSEGTMVGWNPGLGKYEGMVGSYRISWNNLTFDLSGFTDTERQIGYFKEGDILTFKYRGLTELGYPREARYWRRYGVS